MPSGKITAVQAYGTGGRGMLQPDEGGPPLTFDGSNTESGVSGNPHTMTGSDVGSSVTFNFLGGRAVKVKFST